MLTRHEPDFRLDETISHPTKPARVCGFRGRDRIRGVDAIILKGELLPGGDECIGIYDAVAQEVVEDNRLLFVLAADDKVYGTVPANVEASPVQTFEDVPIMGTATMPCVSMGVFAEWDGYTSTAASTEQ